MMSDIGQNKVPLHHVDSESKSITTSTTTSFTTALIAGGLAGTSVDTALFPIDTLKTRMQSPQGFIRAGGFRGIYNGLGAAAVGSAPGAALFFCSYEVRMIIQYVHVHVHARLPVVCIRFILHHTILLYYHQNLVCVLLSCLSHPCNLSEGCFGLCTDVEMIYNIRSSTCS